VSEPRTTSAQAGYAARDAARGLLSAVLDQHQPLDAALEGSAIAGLDPRDRGFARAVAATALRRLGEIDMALGSLIARRPREPAFAQAMRIAAAQILFMQTADHAAVSLAVDMIGRDKRLARYRGLANAVLRRLAREKDAFRAGDPARTNTPEWLWTRWCDAYGEDTARAIATAHLMEPSLDLTPRGDPAALAEATDGTVVADRTVRLLDAGSVENLPGFADGSWWVQDAAAALPARLLGDVAGRDVADLCAAPGGKTAQLAATGATVTAVDVSEHRLGRLAANLERLKLSAATVAADILTWEPGRQFDAVLLDAPCSATGTIRRHPDVARLKRRADVEKLAALQRRMIGRAADLLKPGGTLVVCTCSLETEEGERHLAAVDGGHNLVHAPISPEELPGLADVVTPSGTLRTLPSHLPAPDGAPPRLGGLDGFFAMRFRKQH